MLSKARPEATQNEKYQKYLNSRAWRTKRKRVLERDEHRCQNCGSTTNLQVHHWTYERIFQEPLDDLVTWCKACHEHHHRTEKKKPRSKKAGRTAKRMTPAGVCRVCAKQMEKPYWTPGGGWYCGQMCLDEGKRRRVEPKKPKKRKQPKPIPARQPKKRWSLIAENDKLHEIQERNRLWRESTRT